MPSRYGWSLTFFALLALSAGCVSLLFRKPLLVRAIGLAALPPIVFALGSGALLCGLQTFGHIHGDIDLCDPANSFFDVPLWFASAVVGHLLWPGTAP